jgi:hypothetical protein
MSVMETIDDILTAADRARGIEPASPKVAAVFTPAMLPQTPPLPADGIYFGMPEEAYHALPALSASGIKDLCASPMLYWARSTWLSEKRRAEEAERLVRPDERMFRTIGKAYHCRILEGAEEYAKRFARELGAEECKDALESTDQIKAAIAHHKAKPVSKVPDELPDGSPYERAAKKDDWIAQLLAIDPQARVLPELRRLHAQANAGKAFIPFDAHEQIEIAAAMIEGDEELRHAVKGGYPEVTLIWHCTETGVPMKARVDRLKLKAAVDLKSFENKYGRAVEHAIRYAIASYNYNIQPSVYVEGIQRVRGMCRDGDACIGYDGPKAPIYDWVVRWQGEPDEPEWWWLFQQKGIAPVTRLVQYPLQGVTRKITDEIVRQAKLKFRECSERFGTEPWLDRKSRYMIDDEAIPNSATENLRSE